jgi:hypothetical protein
MPPANEEDFPDDVEERYVRMLYNQRHNSLFASDHSSQHNSLQACERGVQNLEEEYPLSL